MVAKIAATKYFSSTKKKTSANNLFAASCKLKAKCRINVIYLYCCTEEYDIELTVFRMPFGLNYLRPLDFGIAA